METPPLAESTATETEADASKGAETEAHTNHSAQSPFPAAAQASKPDCIACGWGYLYPVGKTEDGTVLRCFNCNRQFSVPDSGEIPPPAVAGVESPTALSPTHQQIADMVEANPDHPVQEVHTVPGSGGAA